MNGEKDILDRILDEAMKENGPNLILVSWKQYLDLNDILVQLQRHISTIEYKTENGEEWVLLQLYGIPVAPILEGNNENNRLGRLLLKEPNICDLREVKEV